MESEGYEILAKEERLLTKEEAAEFYKQHEGSVREREREREKVTCISIFSLFFSLSFFQLLQIPQQNSSFHSVRKI